MVVIKNNVMFSCRAYIFGCEPPEAGKRGVEALQEPITTCYVGISAAPEVEVTVMPDFIHIDYIGADKPNLDLPIHTLSVCAALRRVDSSSGMKFIPVHSVASANEDDVINPPIFAVSIKKSDSDPLECFMFRCEKTREALHLVNATQWAHTSYRKGYSTSGTMRLFFEQSAEFDRTIRLQSTSGSSTRIYSYGGTSGSAARTSEARTYISAVNGYADESYRYTNGTDEHVEEGKTIYIKAGDYRPRTPEPAPEPETIVINANIEQNIQPPPPIPQQTIVVEKPVITPQEPIEIPKPRIIEKEVYIKPPPPPKIEQQVIYVDKPVFGPFKKWEIPEPVVRERQVIIEPPPPPKQEPQVIIVDTPVLKDYTPPPPPEPPIIKKNLIEIEPPPWPKPEPQVIVVDTPVLKPIQPPPPNPPPIVQKKEVLIEPPSFPPQEPHKVIVEVPRFKPMGPAPPPPEPIIKTKEILIDCPPYPEQEPQTIIVEKPIVKPPGPPPKAPPPHIIEKPVMIEGPKYQQPEPQRIIVEKIVFRDPGPPPPWPKPIIIEKKVFVDPPPYPKMEPPTIIVEKPVFRHRPQPPPMKPRIIEKPVYVDVPAPPPPPQQNIVVEKPVFTGQTYTYTRPETRSYVVRGGSPRGLRRYAWSENGDAQGQRWEYRSENGGAYVTNARLYGAPRDFRRVENQFINERRFGTRINQEIRHTRGAGSYTYGEAYRVNNRRESESS